MGMRASAADAEPLLLPEFSGGHGGGGEASVSGAVFNLSTSIVGAGIMSIPAAMRILGVAPTLVLIAAVAGLSDVSVEFMLRYTGWARGPPSYAATMGDSFGRAAAAVLNFFVAFTTAATLVVYLIIIGDVMSGSAGAGYEHAGVLGELFGARWWTGREFVMLATAVVVLLPLVLLRRVELGGSRYGRRGSGGSAPAAGTLRRRGTGSGRWRVGARRGVQRVDERGGRRDHVAPGGHAGARRGPGRGSHRGHGPSRQRRRGLHAPVHPLAVVVRGAHGRLVRPGRGRAAQRLRRLQLRRHAHRLPHNHRGRDVRPRQRREGARRRAAGVVRAALVDRQGSRAGGSRAHSPAASAPEACRFTEVHVGCVNPLGGGVHAHYYGHCDLHYLQRHRQDATDVPGLLPPLLPVRALHRRPSHRPRLHLPLQRAPDPRGAEQDVGHEVGGAHLPGALLPHLRGGGLLRVPPLRGRHHARRARQLRPQLRLGRPTGAQRRGPPQLRAAPRARLPAPPLLAPRQRRRAPLPGPPPAGHGHAPLRGAHGRAHGRALRARHRHTQHLDALPVHRIHVRGVHFAHLPRRHRSQGCSRNSKEEGQGNGGNDDRSGSDHQQHRHCLQHHELHRWRCKRCSCRS